MIEMVAGMSELIKDRSPRDRRPVLAMYTKHFTREEAEELLSERISGYEWKVARQHAKYPGPFEPVIKPKTRLVRYKTEVIVGFLGHLNGYLQDHAYGDKNAVTSTGAMVQIDSVSTTASTAYIMDQYIKNCHPERLQQTEGGCNKRCPKLNIYCLNEDGHSGRCKFTGASMISASSIEKIVNELTAGRLKSMAGLDDEDVKKGSGNLVRVKEIFSLLATMNQISDESIKTMESRIDQILTFHRTGFITHLQRHGDRCCQCISCGLHSEDAPVHCPIRDDDSKFHGSPCNDCDESFRVFSDLLDLLHATQSLPHVISDERLREQYHELEVELNKCRTNFIHWRSHIVRKKVESQYSREQIQNLKPGEVIVICDFKMKILALLMKETKQDFFGKRGTACLGFMVISNQEQHEGFVDVRFYLFFSDDTTQDTNFVLAGKHYIYKEIIPSLFPETAKVKIRFESDGAGSFNSNLAKAAMPFWDTWTDGKVTEIQIRHSVNGDGKSTLDAIFGKLRFSFLNAVQNGITDITDARSCLKAFDDGAGIDGTSAFVIELNRKYNLDVGKNKMSLLLKSHQIVYDHENSRYIAYRNSGYGNGTPIETHSLKTMLGHSPDRPHYNIIRSEPGTDLCTDAAQHSTEEYKSRLKRKVETKRDKANTALVTKEESIVQEAKERGLFLCDALDPITKGRCKFHCNSQSELNTHKESNVHTFPARSQLDEAIALASRADGKCVAYQSRANRNELHSNHTVSDGPAFFGELEAHFDVGCYCKPPPAPKTRLNAELKRILIEFYEAGESANGEGKKASNKYTPAAALNALRAMKNDAGLMKFSSQSEFGELPTEEKIKSFWNRYKQNKKKQDEWVDAALECGNEEVEEANDVDEIMGEIASSTVTRKQNKTRKKQNQGKLAGKKFLVDGDFDDEHGGVVGVEKLIKQHDGAMNKRISKHVGETPFCNDHRVPVYVNCI